MLNIELYAISVVIDGEKYGIVEYFYSFDDARAARKNCANWWYTADEDVCIQRLRKDGISVIEEWRIDKDGNVINHWNYDN